MRALSRVSLLSPFLSVALAACAAGPPRSAMADALTALVTAPELAGGRVGVLAIDTASGRVLAEHSSELGFAPASNDKLITGAVALRTLGADYQFATVAEAHGAITNGVLDGDLVLRGQGDPTFLGTEVEPRLEDLARHLRALGVQRVRGRVVGDGSWLGTETLGLGWQWDYLDEDYAAPFGGLNAAGNVVTLRVQPGADGPAVTVAPYAVVTPQFRITPVAAGGVTSLAAHRTLGGDEVVVTGTLAADAGPQVLTVTAREPTAFAAAVVAAGLRRHGIAVDGEVLAPAGPVVDVMAVASPALATIVATMLTRSDNLYAEVLARAAARVAKGDGSTAAMAAHAAKVLAELGADTAGLVFADGSGLSRRNLVRPRQLVQLLQAMYRTSLREVYLAGLPLAGRTGTLRTRFQDGPAKGHVRAKTGYISRVVCLSGYVPRPDDSAPIVFSVMLNDFTCDDAAAKAAVDRFVTALAAYAGW